MFYLNSNILCWNQRSINFGF